MDVRTFPLQSAPDEAPGYVIYRPLLGLAFAGNRTLADLALSLAAGDAAAPPPSAAVDAFLHQAGFYAPDPPPPTPAGGPFQPTTAVLLMTNQCQLRCTYCYAAAGALPAETLAPELGYAAIDYVCEQARAAGRASFEVSFHGGGEPTRAWRSLRACVDYARRRSLPTRVSLTTNGVWSERQREWLLAHVDMVSLSLDGRPATQDSQRPFVSGRGSADVVMRTARALDEAGKPYGIRMTATAPWDGLIDDVDYLCRHTNCPSFQVEPAFNTARGGHEPGEVADWRAFAEAFVAAYHVARRAGRHLMYSGARLDVATTTFCLAPFGALIVNPRGQLVTCYEITDDYHPLAGLSRIGQIREGRVEIDAPARARLHDLFGERRDGCRDCPCYWSCAGDCYARTFGPGGERHLARGPRCDANRYITGQLLLAEIAAGGGLRRGRLERVVAMERV
jgi:uncharacterized protein